LGFEGGGERSPGGRGGAGERVACCSGVATDTSLLPSILTCRSAVANSPRAKCATAFVDRRVSLRKAYSLTLAARYSEKLARSPASPANAKTMRSPTLTILSSSCLMVMMEWTAAVSDATRAKSGPLRPMKKSMAFWGRSGRAKSARSAAAAARARFAFLAARSLARSPVRLARPRGPGGPRRDRVGRCGRVSGEGAALARAGAMVDESLESE